MKAEQKSSHNRPAVAGLVKAAAVIGAILAAGLGGAALACLDAAPTDHAVTVDTEAVGSIAPQMKVERGGAITGYQLLL